MRQVRLLLLVVAVSIGVGLGEAQVSTPSASGLWLGTLSGGAEKLRLQLHLDVGTGKCSLDSLDQGAMGIACSGVKSGGEELSFSLPSIRCSFHGMVAADGNTLSGTWSQGIDLPLVLTRQKQVLAAAGPPMDRALPPVTLDGMKAVLDRDLAASVASGLLSPAQHGGVVIGVVQNGKRLILSYGAGRPDDLYEIASITKTFTGLILAQMVEQHQVRLDTPVRELLPAGTVAKPASGRELTLLDLSSQHSGLPRLPDNLDPTDPQNPYADYDAAKLYAFMAEHGVAVRPDEPYVYSNVGMALLGQVLANRAGEPYPELLRDEVTGPLGMMETAVPPALASRLAQGYDADHHPARAWDSTALAGSGAIRSTAKDMLTYLEAQLHPEALPTRVGSTDAVSTIPEAIRESHVLHAEAGPVWHIALDWFHYDNGRGYFHSGMSGGYSSFALFNPERNYGFVVLCNTAANGFADMLGEHIAERFEGKPAVSILP
jgi:D-alanyl-D-alanine-carboxypeptidase/D-alanyl-D-alanine-endopeptidase